MPVVLRCCSCSSNLLKHSLCYSFSLRYKRFAVDLKMQWRGVQITSILYAASSLFGKQSIRQLRSLNLLLVLTVAKSLMSSAGKGQHVLNFISSFHCLYAIAIRQAIFHEMTQEKHQVTMVLLLFECKFLSLQRWFKILICLCEACVFSFLLV